jgi:hypothetical protein
MRLIVDRFEGSYAVCEDEEKNMVSILKAELPDDAKEGSVLICDNGIIYVDNAQTAERAEKIKKLMDDLWEK